MLLYIVPFVVWEMGSMVRHVLETMMMLAVTNASWLTGRSECLRLRWTICVQLRAREKKDKCEYMDTSIFITKTHICFQHEHRFAHATADAPGNE